MDIVMMVTGSLGMVGNPTATLLGALVISTIQVGIVQGDAYWTFPTCQWYILSLGRDTL
jgi:predicted ABC-type sugar transport system permease subunit